jgi:hypothetical protein
MAVESNALGSNRPHRLFLFHHPYARFVFINSAPRQIEALITNRGAVDALHGLLTQLHNLRVGTGRWLFSALRSS